MSARDDLNLPQGTALACRTCSWRPSEDLTIGLIQAHFQAEHGTDEVTLDLLVLCPRCTEPMTHVRANRHSDSFECTCGAASQIRRRL